MTLEEQDAAVFRYFVREGRGVDNSSMPCAGLKLNTFRLARHRLIEQGRLVRTTGGRYRPVGEIPS
jgi:hypothetical protein